MHMQSLRHKPLIKAEIKAGPSCSETLFLEEAWKVGAPLSEAHDSQEGLPVNFVLP